MSFWFQNEHFQDFWKDLLQRVWPGISLESSINNYTLETASEICVTCAVGNMVFMCFLHQPALMFLASDRRCRLKPLKGQKNWSAVDISSNSLWYKIHFEESFFKVKKTTSMLHLASSKKLHQSTQEKRHGLREILCMFQPGCVLEAVLPRFQPTSLTGLETRHPEKTSHMSHITSQKHHLKTT